ncbi:MAG TPA: hypothetical protein VG733_14900 [Chthoniobacteraceae bacterium]|nr:hypothetical protein [Chthoniobacteraceae bacterium]
MIYNYDLKTVGLIVGIALVAVHLIGVIYAKGMKRLAQAFPRSRAMGVALLGIATAWAFWLVATMDLGEFSGMRSMLKMIVPIACVLTYFFVEDFLSVRALGMILLLLAEPVLEAAFLRPEQGKLLLVVLAYGWIIFGMFWVGMPYLMRDQIAWLAKSNARWMAACFGGILYGAVVIFCALAYFQSQY